MSSQDRVEVPVEDAEFDWAEMRARVTPVSRELILELAVRLAHRVPGNIVEFGVGKGGSTRVLRRTLTACERWQMGVPRKKIFACDSFKGLRERFENLDVGHFACDPPRIGGVEIVEGYFEDSLTSELAHRVGRVALASLDADLYSSTLCALRWLTPMLHTGSLLLFDEYLGEHRSEQRAHEDWLQQSRLRTVQLAEFFREPSGGGASPERRVLVQAIRSEPFTPIRPSTLRHKLKRFTRALVGSRQPAE
jgi:hypothetical protein